MKPITKLGLADGVFPTHDEIQKISVYIHDLYKRRPDYFEISPTVFKKEVLLQVYDLGEIPKVIYLQKIANLDISSFDLQYNSRLAARYIIQHWKFFLKPDEIETNIKGAAMLSEDEPVNLGFLGFGDHWVFKGIHYSTKGPYTVDEFKLLILDEFDKERKKFESLRQKYGSAEGIESSKSRPRIPEQVRIEVWRRDSGKCARCGSRENLEYDHIVPISKSGSNTARNIELLCEKCNRSKGANIK